MEIQCSPSFALLKIQRIEVAGIEILHYSTTGTIQVAPVRVVDGR